MDKINNIILENPQIVNLNGMLKSNKALHYLTFSIKELVEFYSKKTETGELVLNCRKAALDLKNFELEYECYKKL